MAAFSGPEIVKDGLVLYLDAANDRSYPGTGTAWSDLSGNSNNGTLVNGVGYNSDNLGSLSFDGVNDWVLGDSNLGISGDTSFTISYWAKWTGLNFSTNFPSGVGNNTVSTSNRGLSTTWREGRIALDFWNNRFRASTSLNKNEWYNVVFSKTPGTIGSTCKLYANSVQLSGSVEGSNVTPNVIDSPFVVGRLDSTRWFNGKISCVSIYNRSISELEVKQNFNATRSRFGA